MARLDAKLRSCSMLQIQDSFLWVLPLAFFSTLGFSAEKISSSIPEEYLTTGEQSTALSNGGSLSSAGYSAVRANPAMLAVDRIYTLGGGYHWPSKGRQFYEAGVVDGKASSVAAGLVYTSSLDNYEGSWKSDGAIETGDIPVKRRVNFALAYTFKTIAVGLSGGMVEASDPSNTFDKEADRVRGYTLGGGVMAGLTRSLRTGFSVENLANKKVAYAAPTIYRAGLAWAAAKEFNVYFDYRYREAIDVFESAPPDLFLFADVDEPAKKASAEQAVMLGGMARVYDLLRFTVAAGVAEAAGESVMTTSGGLALVNKSFSLSYSAQRPNMRLSEIHHSASLGLDVAL